MTMLLCIQYAHGIDTRSGILLSRVSPLARQLYSRWAVFPSRIMPNHPAVAVPRALYPRSRVVCQSARE